MDLIDGDSNKRVFRIKENELPTLGVRAFANGSVLPLRKEL